MELLQRFEQVKKRIVESCHRVGRDPNDIKIVAVTKYVDLERTKEALDLGLDHIGESRIQDAMSKWEQLGDRGVWHFIGHLQRNKVKNVITRFSYIHSLDRFSLAKEIDKRGQALDQKIKCFLQVNITGEKQKFGISPQELEDFAGEVANLSFIEIAGLMTMAPLTPYPEETRSTFRELKHLQLRLQQKNHPGLQVPHLSMGMSQDFEVAIEEGAHWIRLGSVLVGKRS